MELSALRNGRPAQLALAALVLVVAWVLANVGFRWAFDTPDDGWHRTSVDMDDHLTPAWGLWSSRYSSIPAWFRWQKDRVDRLGWSEAWSSDWDQPPGGSSG